MIAFLVMSAVVATSGRDADAEKKLRAQLEQVAPAAVKTFDEATQALDDRRYEEARQGFEAVVADAPSFDAGHRRLCATFLELERYDAARPECAKAVELSDTFDNRVVQARLLVAAKSPGDRAAVGLWLNQQVRQQKVGSDEWCEVKLLQCLLATNAGASGNDCFEEFVTGAPQQPIANYLSVVAAAQRDDWGTARERLERARPGISAEMYEKMKGNLDDAEPAVYRYGWPALFTLGAWAGALLLLVVLGLSLSSITTRTAHGLSANRDPHASTGHGLRALYRLIVGAGSMFYYVSLPIVLLAVIALGGGVLYACLYIGRVPIKLVAIAGLMVLVTVGAVVKSLFVRAPDLDPGEKLDWAKAPKLRAMLDRVAKTIGTRPVDNVYLTPGTELAVTERGGLRKRWAGTSERCLILGIGVLDGLKVGPFTSVLAHEHGHFSNEDTAGGDLALWARRSMLTMGFALARGGAAAWYNPAWLFFRAYFAIFLRISQGASRLQEVLADRRAIFAYGSAAFRDGYTHVIRRSVAFDAHASATLKEVIEQKKGLSNLYRFVPVAPVASTDVEQQVVKHLEEEAGAYDSHPSGKDRLAWAAALAIEVPQDAQAEEDAWALFESREELEQHLTNVVRNNIAEAHQVVIAQADAVAPSAPPAGELVTASEVRVREGEGQQQGQ